MVIGKRTAAASTSERSRWPLRIAFTLIALLTAIASAPGSSCAADNGFVQQDRTPLVSKPGVGGKIVAWVDAGFPLTILAQDGDWLKVSSSRLKIAADGLWVPSARVANRLPGEVEATYPNGGMPNSNGMGLRLEIYGSPDNRVRARCRVAQEGDDDFADIVDEVPIAFDLDGPAADCTVRRLDGVGQLDAVLRAANGVIIANASTIERHGAVRLRTNGPWGGASGRTLPARFTFFKGVRTITPSGINGIPPMGNPTPPLGNPTPALGNPTLPLGNPTPALGNPTPALGNPTPSFGNTMSSFQRSPVLAP